MNTPNNSITAVTAEDGLTVSVVGDTYRILITGEQTNGAYAAIDMFVPPQGGPGPHAHANFQESFYVIDGEVEVKTESQTFTARKGSFINIPLGGIVHCFKNQTTTTAHLLCVVVPSGLEVFFQEIGIPITVGSFMPPPIMSEDEKEHLQRVAEKYGQKLFPPDYLD